MSVTCDRSVVFPGSYFAVNHLKTIQTCSLTTLALTKQLKRYKLPVWEHVLRQKPANTIQTCILGTRALKKTAKNNTNFKNENRCSKEKNRNKTIWEEVLPSKYPAQTMQTSLEECLLNFLLQFLISKKNLVKLRISF